MSAARRDADPITVSDYRTTLVMQ